MAINERAAIDSRHSRSGKDAGIYDEDGVLIASMESFQSNVNFTNGSYKALGHMMEYETPQSYKVAITASQIVIEDDKFIQDIFEYMETGQTPIWVIQGVLQGRNGSEERVVYRDCIPTGQIDIQNFSTGDLIKRNWNFAVNRPPKLQSLLTID